MFEDFLMVGGGLIILASTFVLFWLCTPKPNGPPRWFIGTGTEPLISVALTCGIVLGIGTLIAGVSHALGVR